MFSALDSGQAVSFSHDASVAEVVPHEYRSDKLGRGGSEKCSVLFILIAVVVFNNI